MLSLRRLLFAALAVGMAAGMLLCSICTPLIPLLLLLLLLSISITFPVLMFVPEC